MLAAPKTAVRVERPAVASPETCFRSFVSRSAMLSVSIVCAPAGPASR